MVEFSNTQDVDNPVLPCQQGNLFLNCLPLDAPAVEFSVNGKSTGALPTGLTYKLENSLEGTISRLTFTHLDTGREITLIEDLDEFTQNRPEDVGVFVGTEDQLPPAPAAPPTESRLDRARRLLRTRDMPSPVTYGDELSRLERIINSGNADNDTRTALDKLLTEIENHAIANGYIDPITDEEDVMLLEVPAWLEPFVTEGDFDIEKLNDEAIKPIAIAIAGSIELIDERSGIAWVKAKTSGAVDLSLGGTTTVPFAAEMIDMLRHGENRAFLREAIKLTRQPHGRVGRIWRNAGGKLMVSFRGYAGLRHFITGTAYGMANSKVSVLAGAINNSTNWAGGAIRSVAGRIPVISYLIVGTIDLVEWWAEDEATLYDLAAMLFVDIAKIAISTMVATGTAIALVAFAGIPIIAVVAGGIAAGIVVGFAMDFADTQFDITANVKTLANEAGASLEQFMQRREQDISITDPELYEGMMTAP